MHTTVAVVGGGPAGLLLARLLRLADIDCVVLERRDRAYVEQRQRAGVLEQSTVDALREAGAAERLDAEGLVHSGVELRWDGRSHRIDFPSLTGGRRVWVYAQTEVVKDLIALHRATGTPVHFEAEVRAVEGVDTERPTVRYTHRGQERTLTCDYVVGCDGYHGVARTAVPQGVRRTYERVYPYSWLGVTAEVPPSCDELVYAHSPRGFALHSMRSPEVSRLYLQVPNGTDPAHWSDERIWDELEARFALDGRQLGRGPVTAKAVLPLRSSVTEPMRHGRLFLAGDAAHIVPPTGAKGLNLAVSDAVVLARALVRRRHTGETDLLDAYSDTCLRRVWRAEHFSYFMTTTLHTDPGQSRFDTRLQIAQLDRIAASPHAEAELALNYAGLPLP
ncbi:4-hydroxybenzoate 3-monooxygenase [Streptomyces sp. WAC08241]|uniref:4-hydroxybenzoate 3-monooxygenase n=1 Tax=Streptomyces sp. WAC08241 TaxID=2487421 RepID=UPI000F7A259B|nr:4-hydroxybenzoate 3-monooxygenase [Streptomyces sp. WAC08241]RSS34785.1 4-hydroxybenzoate 3-monooxygenase [Streptomyces sp. WAC08241]